MNTNPNNLLSKFYPYLLGHHSCPANFKNDIDNIFKNPQILTKLTSNVFDAGNWILKNKRKTLTTTHDTHLYRIRKAEKIRSYIAKNGLENHFAIPQKYLYWHEKENQFYVLSEKLDLSSEVAQPRFQETIDGYKTLAHVGGQITALSEGKPMREITAIQAKALAELSFLGYTDMSYNNFYFTKDGKIAIIDTEPVKRINKKLFAKNLSSYFLGDKGFLLTSHSITGIAKLKLFLSNPLALKEVEKVEKKHVLFSLAKLVGKAALTILAAHLALAANALIPIAGIASVLKVSIITFAILKTLILTLNVISVYVMWKRSYEGIEGVAKIQLDEERGLC